jgi:tRNA(adenine34) deaminase
MPEGARLTEMNQDETWMAMALEEAAQAAREGEVPIGAVAVLEGRLLARDHNRTIQLNDPSAHGEMLVLRRAAGLVGNYRLPGLELVVTLEPCAMCAGAMIWARVARLVFGAWDQKAGAVGSKLKVLEPGLLNHDVVVVPGILEERCRVLLQQFFRPRRAG